MINLASDDNSRDADFIDCAASAAELTVLEYAKRRKLFVDEFDKRVEALVDQLHARLNTLADDLCGEFDILIMDYRNLKEAKGRVLPG